MFNDLRREVIVRFVDICGIVDYHYLNFLFIMVQIKKGDMVFNATYIFQLYRGSQFY
jgi:hypothetical protein